MEGSKNSKPNRVALTLAKARDAKLPDKGDYTLWDGETRGLGLRIYASGAKVWIVQKKLGKTPKRVVLGHFPNMTLAKAREEAPDAIQKIRKGIDPNLEKRQQLRETEKAREREKITIGFAFSEYLAYAKGEELLEKADTESGAPTPNASANTIRDLENAKRRLEDGTLWKLPIEAVDGSALHKEYLRLCRSADSKKNRNGGRTAAGGILRYVRAAFNRAGRKYKLKLDNPFLELNNEAPGWQTAPARKKIIADAEGDIGRWWVAVEALRSTTDSRARDSSTISDWLQVALLLGGRKTESLSLRWEDIDFKRGVGVFRETKSGEPHHFPLAPYVRSTLERRKIANDQSEQPSEYVFHASRTGWKSKTRTHIKEPKKSLAKVQEASGISFAPHDLRRTFGTLFTELKVGDATVKKALNHAPTDITSRHYIQTRMKTMLPIYERLETLILTEAGVMAKLKKRTARIQVSEAEFEEFKLWKTKQKRTKTGCS